MVKSWPGYLPPVVAFVLTLMGTGLFAFVLSGDDGSVPLALVMMLGPLILAISVLWGLALVTGRPLTLTFGGALASVVISLIWLPHEVVLLFSGTLAAGLFAGYAFGLRLRLDLLLLAMCLILSCVPVLSFTGWDSLEEEIRVMQAELMTFLEESLPEDVSEKDRQRTLEMQKESLNLAFEQSLKVFPALSASMMLWQGALMVVLLGVRLRRMGLIGDDSRPAPFIRWKLPFHLVWVLAAGVGLMVTRAPTVATVGLNLAIFAAAAMFLQGLAIQVFVTRRMMAFPILVVYWIVMVLFLPLLVLASGVVLGLADQWWDIRRLETAPDSGDGN